MSDEATPSGVEIIAKRPDGSTVNVTAGVQTLYDTVIQSMDWGSGFLTVEDTEPILEIATVCGFKGFEEAEKYVAEERLQERRRNCAHPRRRYEPYTGHDQSGIYLSMICEDCGWSGLTTKTDREAWTAASR